MTIGRSGLSPVPLIKPWNKFIYDTLASGEWISREWLINEASKLVPPGVAFRSNTLKRARLSRRDYGRDYPIKPKAIDDATRAYNGAREIVRKSLSDLVYYSQRPDRHQRAIQAEFNEDKTLIRKVS